jgi:hypothetical protein
VHLPKAVSFFVFASQLVLVGQVPQSKSASYEELAAQLAKAHKAWSPTLNSIGASLVLKEAGRRGATTVYRLFAAGLPKDASYTLLSWPVTAKGPSAILSGIGLDDTGMAICPGRPGTCGTASKPNDPIDLPMVPVKGEPVRLAIVSGSDPKVRALLNFAPIPNESQDGACHIQAVLLTPGAEAVAIQGTGFEPNSEVIMDSKSADEGHQFKGKAEADGSYFALLLPYRAGAKNGTTHVILRAARCKPVLDFSWGH